MPPYISDMRPPTYQLGPDFDTKLTSFVRALLSAGDDIFGSEFQQIDEFVRQAKRDTSERDDHDLRRTPRQVYLLEAIAYKLYDQTNRDAFNHTKETLIIVPDCLSLHNPECEKADRPHGDECGLCTPECQVFEIEKLASKYGATVLFSKRKLEEQLEYHSRKSEHLGVIGIACLLMLAGGMRTCMELSLPVRGVPLNFCGCEHWNKEPFASQLPIERLQQILEEKYGR